MNPYYYGTGQIVIRPFFDFDEEQLRWLLSTSADGSAYVPPFSRTFFIALHRSGEPQAAHYFDENVNEASKSVAACESNRQGQALNRAPLGASPGLPSTPQGQASETFLGWIPYVEQ